MFNSLKVETFISLCFNMLNIIDFKTYVKCPSNDEASESSAVDNVDLKESVDNLMEQFVSFSWQIAQGMVSFE